MHFGLIFGDLVFAAVLVGSDCGCRSCACNCDTCDFEIK